MLLGCNDQNGHSRMVRSLQAINQQIQVPQNFFCPEAKVKYYDSIIAVTKNPKESLYGSYMKGYFLMQSGETEQAIEIYEHLLSRMDPKEKEANQLVNQYLGVAYLRLGEQANCITNRESESCIFPIQGNGIHKNLIGSKKSISHFENILRETPDDLETRWLLNIAYMTLGLYPGSVPKEFIIPGLAEKSDTGIRPFIQISNSVGLNYKNMSGGSIVEDFNLDGHLDIVTSGWGLDEPMHFFVNDGNGGFIDSSQESQLSDLMGGLNIMQTDYNNDGYPDIFVLRGGWMREFGRQPNSLIRNNGDGTFNDVTFNSGLLSFLPTQTATWNDFNNDGWLDVFIGNESSMLNLYPCELYINQKNGTFRNAAVEAGISVINYVKGVTSGDYNNDGWIDIFISTMNYKSYLFKNQGGENGSVKFVDVSEAAGFQKQISKTFPTWFWDYNNDGWLDIFLCAFEFDKSLGYYEASEKLGLPAKNESKMKLYRNNGDGTFSNVAEEVGLGIVANAMGSNFGDIDNDGFLDFYLGTGNPDSKSIIPNKLFKNINGDSFIDVSASARVGHLQKGHGISFADLDYDGDQDIFMEVGGSFKGESVQNSLYLNPGQNENNWIGIRLTGVQSNRLAIGSRITLSFSEAGRQRKIYRDVNAGGSFGSSPIQAHIGIGKAINIDSLEIRWSGSNLKQVFTNLNPNQWIRIVEGSTEIEIQNPTRISFIRELP